MKDIETSLIDASRAFTGQLHDTVQSLRSLEGQIIDATKASVASVQLQVEALGRNFSQSLAQFYGQLIEENRSAYQAVFADVQKATERLSSSMDSYAVGLQGQLGVLERKVSQFSDAVQARISNTTFPDDYFSRQLAQPLAQLKSEAETLGSGVRDVTDRVTDAAAELAAVLKTINTRTRTVQSTLEAVTAITEQQSQLTLNSGRQSQILDQMTQRLEQMQSTLAAADGAIKQNQTTTSQSAAQLSALVADSKELRGLLREAAAMLSRSAQNGDELSQRITKSQDSLESMTQASLQASAQIREVAASLLSLGDSLQHRDRDIQSRLAALTGRPVVTTPVSSLPPVASTYAAPLTDAPASASAAPPPAQ